MEEELIARNQAGSGLNQKVNHLMQMNQHLQQVNRALNHQLSDAGVTIGRYCNLSN